MAAHLPRRLGKNACKPALLAGMLASLTPGSGAACSRHYLRDSIPPTPGSNSPGLHQTGAARCPSSHPAANNTHYIWDGFFTNSTTKFCATLSPYRALNGKNSSTTREVYLRCRPNGGTGERGLHAPLLAALHGGATLLSTIFYSLWQHASDPAPQGSRPVPDCRHQRGEHRKVPHRVRL